MPSWAHGQQLWHLLLAKSSLPQRRRAGNGSPPLSPPPRLYTWQGGWWVKLDLALLTLLLEARGQVWQSRSHSRSCRDRTAASTAETARTSRRSRCSWKKSRKMRRMDFDNSPVHSRKDWGLRTARGLTLPARLVSNLEGTLLPPWVAALKARLNAQRWITSLSWRLIPWLPRSFC